MKIDKKVPIPIISNRGEDAKVIAKMKVGDSVFFTNPKEANRFVACCIQTFRKWTFTRRTLDNGIRIWRTE